MEIARIVGRVTNHAVQLIVSVLEMADTFTIGKDCDTCPHGSSNAGTTDDNEATGVSIIHGNTGVGIRNHSDIWDTALTIAIEAVLVGWAVLERAQTTTAAIPGTLTDV